MSRPCLLGLDGRGLGNLNVTNYSAVLHRPGRTQNQAAEQLGPINDAPDTVSKPRWQNSIGLMQLHACKFSPSNYFQQDYPDSGVWLQEVVERPVTPIHQPYMPRKLQKLVQRTVRYSQLLPCTLYLFGGPNSANASVFIKPRGQLALAYVGMNSKSEAI